MSKRTRRRLRWTTFLVLLAAVVIFDLTMTHTQRGYITLTGAGATGTDLPVVALSTSADLSPALPLDSPDISYEQVKELVYLALDRDTSPGNLSSTVERDDWVGIKVNIVGAPLVVDGSKKTGFWVGRERNVPHWGSVGDLRVTKAIIAYLIERVGPERISIIEGAGGWARTGSPYFDSDPVDGWTCTWEAFDNLSYVGITEEFNAAQSGTLVDIVDLNDDDPVLEEVPGGGLQLLGGRHREWGYDDLIPGYGTPRGSWYVPRTLMEIDKLINQPTLKTTAPGITVFMKNYVGAVGMRGYESGPGKGSVIDGVAIMPGYMDIVKIRPPDYNVAAGFWSSDGWYGRTYDINHNVVIAGHNVVASEAVAARIMGFNPRDLQQMLLARDIGLGSFEEADYRVLGGNPSQLVRRFPGNPGFKPSGFQDFLMLGPFDEGDIDIDLLGNEAHARGAPQRTAGGQTWWTYTHRPGYPEPYTDFSHLDLGDLDGKTMYAFLYVESDRAQDGALKFGSDGAARVWVNGESVMSTSRSSVYERRPTNIHLQKGVNAVLVKVVGTFRGAGFGLSVVDDGETPRMLTDIRPKLSDATPTAVLDDVGDGSTPAFAALGQGFPNPFNATITIPFVLPHRSHVRISVVNSMGQTVRVLSDDVRGVGTHRIRWDGRDESGREAASGTYLVSMEAANAVQVQKVTLLK